MEREHCSENLAFLDWVAEYRRTADPLFAQSSLQSSKSHEIGLSSWASSPTEPRLSQNPLPPVCKPDGMSESEYKRITKTLAKMKETCQGKFFLRDGPLEVGIPGKMKAVLLDAMKQPVTHPGAFSQAYEHVMHEVKSDMFAKFLQTCAR